MTNVLLTSVGRRSYLVEYFKQALGTEGRVICANMYTEAAGMYAADVAVKTPPAQSDEYVPALLDICTKYEVNLLCSLHDLDVYILSQHSELFRDVSVTTVLPSAEWGRIALDKYECTSVLRDHGIDVPQTSIHIDDVLEQISQGILGFPLIVKARFGFGSLGAELCLDADELKRAYESCRAKVLASGVDSFVKIAAEESVLVQSLIKGREFCVGIANDLTGSYRGHFVCEVHTMRAGESDIATSIDIRVVGDLPKKISALTRHPGIWGVDCVDDGGVLRVIDINPRFTGDYPFHHLAGADMPAALINWVNGEEADSHCFVTTPGVRGFKDLVPKISGA